MQGGWPSDAPMQFPDLGALGERDNARLAGRDAWDMVSSLRALGRLPRDLYLYATLGV